jgi:hypothetical protein
MRGLDPRIHEALQQKVVIRLHALDVIMDCRVKLGNDGAEAVHYSAVRYSAAVFAAFIMACSSW